MARRYNLPAYAESVTQYVREISTILNTFFAEVSSVQDSITAGSTQTQAGATPLVLGFNRVTSASANDGVRLPITSGGAESVVRNDSGATIKVWPHLSGKINGGTVNAAVTQATGTTVDYRAIDETNWYD